LATEESQITGKEITGSEFAKDYFDDIWQALKNSGLKIKRDSGLDKKKCRETGWWLEKTRAAQLQLEKIVSLGSLTLYHTDRLS
jgi:hypothetical protein